MRTLSPRQYRSVFALCVTCIVAGVTLTLYPFLPLVAYSIHPPAVATTNDAATTNTDMQGGTLPTVDATHGDRLLIPSIGVDIPVVEGADETALNNGAWRIPGTSQDPNTGNMVLSAHRFRYRPPSSETFYLLNKLKAGDTITLVWHGTTTVYHVVDSLIVAPSAVEVLAPTDVPTLTLITCTPLFSTAQRLVVRAERNIR